MGHGRSAGGWLASVLLGLSGCAHEDSSCVPYDGALRFELRIARAHWEPGQYALQLSLDQQKIDCAVTVGTTGPESPSTEVIADGGLLATRIACHHVHGDGQPLSASFYDGRIQLRVWKATPARVHTRLALGEQLLYDAEHTLTYAKFPEESCTGGSGADLSLWLP